MASLGFPPSWEQGSHQQGASEAQSADTPQGLPWNKWINPDVTASSAVPILPMAAAAQQRTGVAVPPPPDISDAVITTKEELIRATDAYKSKAARLYNGAKCSLTLTFPYIADISEVQRKVGFAGYR